MWFRLSKTLETTVPTVVNMRCAVDAVDFAAADWGAAWSSPVKFVLNRLKMPNASRVMAVWGRSYRNDGKPCSPLEAASIRFHMAVGEEFATDILRQSGFSKVSITAVKDDYRADRQYYVIWLKVNRPEVEAILQTVPTHYGYVRGRSGFGVRCLLAKAKECGRSAGLVKTSRSLSRPILSTDCMVVHRTLMPRFLRLKNRAGRCDRSVGIVLVPGRLPPKLSGRMPRSC